VRAGCRPPRCHACNSRGATIFFGTDSLTSNAKVVHRARFNFFSEARIWYNRGNEDRLLGEPYENVIDLSNEFFEEVTAQPFPTDLVTSKGPERIPIFGPFGLVQQLGAVEYARPRKFREKLHQWLKTIRLVWPECPAQITADGETLRINPIHSAVTQESRSECLD
jgi:hypothetical protein